MLSSIIRRPTYGIHNRSYGLVDGVCGSEMLSCPAKDTRWTYGYPKEFLVEEDIKT